jgi:transcriptional regulator with XRE-family HTH domain
MSVGRRTDFARLLVERRNELGLTTEQLARRAGMAAGYLDYLEQSSGAVTPQTGLLLRLAAALETTPAHLTAGEIERAPGISRARAHLQFDVLSREQCAARLAIGGVGRFLFVSERGPVALPVYFVSVGGDIILRTRVGGGLGTTPGSTVSFEVDRIDATTSEGWSVLVTGPVRLVDEPSELAQLRSVGISPWPGGHRALCRIESREVHGCEISSPCSIHRRRRSWPSEQPSPGLSRAVARSSFGRS